jgi:hypothetical protein
MDNCVAAFSVNQESSENPYRYSPTPSPPAEYQVQVGWVLFVGESVPVTMGAFGASAAAVPGTAAIIMATRAKIEHTQIRFFIFVFS